MRRSFVRLSLSCAAAGLVLAASARADSLWNRAPGGGRSLVSDHRASRVGDIVTITIQENTSAQNSQKSSADKSSSAGSAITQLLFPNTGTHNGNLPATSFSGANDFSANGEINNKAVVTGRAAVLVTDVLPNGNLVVEGVRVVVTGGEKLYIVLSGVIRPQDISSTNTVVSSNVANARVEFVSEGKITDTQRKGWLTRLYETLRLY